MANIFDQFDAPDTSSGGGNIFDQFDEPAAQTVAPGKGDQQPQQLGFVDRWITNPLGRGKNQQLDPAYNVGMFLAGQSSPEDFAQAIVTDFNDAAAYPRDPRDEEASRKFQGAEGYWDMAKIVAQNPSIAAQVIMESTPGSVAGAGGSLVGGLAGGAAGSAVPVLGTAAGATYGALTGAGLASGYIEFSNSLTQALTDTGKPVTRENVLAAIQDPDLMAVARDKALKRGVAVGVFDAISAGVAGKIAKPVEKLAGTGVAGRVAGATAEVGAQGGLGATGEATAQVATDGRITSPGDVFLEGVGELGTAPIEIAGAVAGREVPPKILPGQRQPGAQQRTEPSLFDPLQQPPGAPPPAAGNVFDQFDAGPTVNDDDAYLVGAGYSPEQISDMNLDERSAAAQEARAQGVVPVDIMAGAPAPGTAPRAPAGTRRARQPIQTPEDLEAVRPVVNAEPSEAQKAAGNYQLAHVKLHGFDISIETPRGVSRTGTDKDGEPWQSPPMPGDYGYFKRTEGRDGDKLDVYIGPDPTSTNVYIVEQHDLKTGKFDELKVVMGARDLDEAVGLYTSSFDNPTLDRIGDVTEMPVEQFKEWLKQGNGKRPVAKSIKDASKRNARTEQDAGTYDLAADQAAMPQSPEQAVSPVRGTGNYDAPGMGGGFSGVPAGRRPAPGEGYDAGPDQQRPGVSAGQYAVDGLENAVGQSQGQGDGDAQWGANDGIAGVTQAGAQSQDSGRPPSAGIPNAPSPVARPDVGQTPPQLDDLDTFLNDAFAEEYGAQKDNLSPDNLSEPINVDRALSKYIGGKKPLTQEAFAKHAGIDVNTAGRALQQAAMSGRIQIGRNGQFRRPRTYSTPPNLLDYVSQWGVQDPTGELAGMDIPKMGRHGPIIRANGLSLDDLRERLIEDGYLQDRGWGTDQQQETTVADVLDLFGRHMGGDPVYSIFDQAQADDIAATKKAEAQNPELQDYDPIVAQYGPEVRADMIVFFAENGGSENDWSIQEIEDAARLMAGGMDADSAFERAAFMAVERDPDDIIIDPAMEAAFRKNNPNVMVAFDVPPFPDVETETDAVEQQGSPEEGEGLRAAGEDGNVARSEGDVGAETAPVRDAGESGPEAGSEEPAAEGVEPSTEEFIADIEDRIAAGENDVFIAPTTDGSEFRAAIEARGWKIGKFGKKGKAFYSPNRDGYLFYTAAVEGNRLNVQFSPLKPGEEGNYPDFVTAAAAPTTEQGADNKPQTVLPGAEQASPDEVKGAKLSDAARKELEIRKKQSKLRKGNQKGVDEQPGGMFEEKPEDLFSAPQADTSIDDALSGAFEEEFGAEEKPAADDKPFDAKAWQAERDATINASKAAGNKHLDDIPAAVESMRGLEIYNAHDPKERGTVRTVDNRGNVYVNWADQYSAEKNLASPSQEKIGKGKEKTVYQTDLGPKDLKDYVIADGAKQPAQAPKTAGQAATSAVKNTAAGIGDAVKGLNALFGDKDKLSSGFTFDEDAYQKALPFFRAAVAHLKNAAADLKELARALVRSLRENGLSLEAAQNMRPYLTRFIQDIRDGKESLDAPGSSEILEPDRGDAAAGDGVGAADVPAPAGADGQGAGKRGNAGGRAGGRGPRSGGSVSQSDAPVVGEGGNLEVPARDPEPLFSNPPDTEPSGSPADGGQRLPDERVPTLDAIKAAAPAPDLATRKRAQQAAEKIAVKLEDRDNIGATLPLLHPEQQDDVYKVEQRFAKPDGHGMLLTNGTGTGKTFSGLGVVKRFAKQGKTNILIVAPSQGILEDWVKAATSFGLDVSVLESTKTAGKGIVATTYANLGQNPTLADRNWNLVVTDESHKLSSDAAGTATASLGALRAITLHPDGMYRRGQMVFSKEWDRVESLKPVKNSSRPLPGYEEAFAAWRAKYDAARPEWEKQSRGKVLMLSATPFAYHFSLDYAEGYLFQYPEVKSRGGYNQPGPRDQFYIENFGYQMRTNKLNKPDADVRSEVMERQFHEKLKKSGALSGRALEVEKDYDRKFILVESGIGAKIDEALKFLRSEDDGKFWPLFDIIYKQFDHLSQLRLLEAIKAQAAIPYIRKSIALGRKVVVFHDYNEGGGISPFELSIPEDLEVTVTGRDGKQKKVKPAELYREFHARNPWVKQLKFGDYPAPIIALKKAFPNALVYNGTIPEKQRSEAKRLFNADNNGFDVIIVQSAAGEAGISLHDITNVHQRTLVNLGMPPRPMTALQQEGRIYRVGQASDALFRYMNTGTAWERHAFATKMAQRSSTTENLAMGDQARTIRQSFIDAYEAADDYEPAPGEGKGGKAIDRANNETLSEFEKAKTHYFAQAKNKKRRDQREGIDYFATPEPLGLKMVEWANVKPGEKILEPSAGHGAIARYFPEDTARTMVEPTDELASRAALASPGARLVMSRFEDLDIVNKYDAIVMNPPFGTGAKMAIDHIEKAAKHLKNGGRIVAMIPRGGMADKRFEQWYDNVEGVYLVGNILLPSVTFERAGTSVSARIVILEKQTDKDVRPQEQRNRDYSNAETINELFDRIEDADMGQRIEPKSKEIDTPTEGEVTVADIKFYLRARPESESYFADLKSFIGDRWKAVNSAAESQGGRYNRPTKTFIFGSAEARQRFLDAVANPPAEQTAAATPASEASPAATGAGPKVKTSEFLHTKTRQKVYAATVQERMSPDEYRRVLGIAKKHGGYYSSFKGGGAVPGFHFPSEDARIQFMAELAGPPQANLSSRGQSRLSSAAKKPVFYSAMLRAVEGMKQASAPKAQWMGMIRNAPSVKPEEIAWIGLEDWLSQQSGHIPKEKIVDFIKANQVEVQEVVKEKPDPTIAEAKLEAMIDEEYEKELAEEIERIEEENEVDLPSLYVTEEVDEDGETYWALKDGQTDEEVDQFDSEEKAEAEEQRLSDAAYKNYQIDVRRAAEDGVDRAEIERRVRRDAEHFGEVVEDDTKYASYQLPGGKNYRELLLTLPTHGKSARGATEAEINRINSRLVQQGYDGLWENQREEALKGGFDAIEMLEDIEARTGAKTSDVVAAMLDGAGRYRSSHWEEENILAHIRFNERTDADGKRVLFVEEIQSDWHQMGRKQGYERKEKRVTNYSLLNENGEHEGTFITREDAERRREQINGRRHPGSSTPTDTTNWTIAPVESIVSVKGVPDAPFKTSWQELAMKRMIRWAAENGFDRVAWTPGEVQAERYDLSKHIDAIAYQKRGDVYALEVRRKGAFETQSIGEHSAEQLENQIGKEMAEKIVKGEGKTVGFYGSDKGWKLFEGLDLKVGGSGMAGFYDKILVDTANKLGKKWGAKVGKAGFEKFKGVQRSSDGRWRFVDHEGLTRTEPSFATRDEAAGASLFANDITAHSLDITPEMARAAMEGQPLFKRKAKEEPGIPANRINPYRFVITAKQQKAISAEINQIAERILGRHNRGVGIVSDRQAWNSMAGPDEDAQFDPNTGVIWLALQGYQNPLATLRHEAVHALRQAGVIGAQEWAILSKMAQTRWIEQFNIRNRYEELYRERFDITPAELEDLLVEEAVADAMAEQWNAAPTEDVIGRIRARIKAFLEAVRNMLRGQGFTTADQVLQRIESGKMGRRAAGSGQDRGFMLWAKEEAEAGLASRGRPPEPSRAPDDGGRGGFTVPPSTPEEDAMREFAGNINLNYIDSPEAVKDVLRDAARQAEGFIAARRGVVSHDQTRLLAETAGVNIDILLNRPRGEAWNAHEIYAARAMLIKSGDIVRRAAARIPNSTSDVDRAHLMRVLTRHAAIQEQIAGMTAEAGRALNQFKMLAGVDYIRGVTEMLAERSRGGMSGPEMVDDLARNINQMETPQQIGRMARSVYTPGYFDMIREFYINSLLSGPTTHVVNFLSNILTALNQIPESFLAEQIGKLHGGPAVARGETIARAFGLIEASREGLALGWETLLTGEPQTDRTQFDAPVQKAIPGVIGEVVRIPSRFMMASDDLFKTVNYRAELNALALRLANREGLTGQALAERVLELRNDPTPQMMRKASDAAKYQTFQAKLGPKAQTLMRLRESVPILVFVLPFLRTPINILKYAYERTPLAALPLIGMKEVKEALSGQRGGAARDIQIARMLLGTIAITGMGALALGGMATGGGDDDQKKKAVARATGWQPYSIKWGDTYYSYLRFDPFSLHLGIVADMTEFGGKMKEGDYDQLGWMLLSSITSNIVDKTWLRGAAEFTKVLNEPDRYMPNYMAHVASGFVPNVLAQVARTKDPVLRDARSFMDKIKERLPGWKETLPARIDIFGETIQNEGNLGPDLLSPVYISSQKDNPVAKAMVDADYYPGPPRRHLNGHDLTPEQYALYAEIAGRRAVKRLMPIVSAPNWPNRSQEQKEKIIKRAYDDAREFARNNVMRTYPELRKSGNQ